MYNDILLALCASSVLGFILFHALNSTRRAKRSAVKAYQNELPVLFGKLWSVGREMSEDQKTLWRFLGEFRYPSMTGVCFLDQTTLPVYRQVLADGSKRIVIPSPDLTVRLVLEELWAGDSFILNCLCFNEDGQSWARYIDEINGGPGMLEQLKAILAFQRRMKEQG